MPNSSKVVSTQGKAKPPAKQELTANAHPMDALIERAATDPSFSVEKLDAMLDMKLKYDAVEAKKAFAVALAKFSASCPTIDKDSLVDFTGQKGRTKYSHASLAGTLNTIKPHMKKAGLSHSWRTEDSGKSVKVTCIVYHIAGHSEETSLSASYDNTGNKNDIQQAGSTVTYLERYTLFAILGLAAEEKDDDGRGRNAQPQPPARKPQPKATPEQIKHVNTLIDNEDALGFYVYVNKATEETQKAIFNTLQTDGKKMYREMEKEASNIVHIYADAFDARARESDKSGMEELILELKTYPKLMAQIAGACSELSKSMLAEIIEEVNEAKESNKQPTEENTDGN